MKGDDVPQVRIRSACPDDVARIGDLARGLSPHTMRLRFMGGVAPDRAIDELQRELFTDGGEAVVAEDPEGQIVAEAFAAAAGRGEAELAFVVSDRWQSHGIGTRLLAALVERLRARGIQHAYADTLLENREMLDVLRHSGLPSTEEYREGVIRVGLDLRASG